MRMKLKLKKTKSGFTLVELVVVIAVIAILSAAAIGAYFGITKQARISADKQVVTQINEALLFHERGNNDQKCKTMQEAVDVAYDAGFRVEVLTPTYDGYDMVWDQKANRFALLEK